MTPNPKPPPLTSTEVALLAMLGGLVLIGLAANSPSLIHSLVAVGVLAAVLLIARLWQWTRRVAVSWRELTSRQRVFQLAVFLAWLAVIAALAWGWSFGLFE